jgi:hypothetical protein
MRLKIEVLDEYGHPMRRNRKTREAERALDQIGMSPEELATWFEMEGRPEFGDAIRRLFGLK